MTDDAQTIAGLLQKRPDLLGQVLSFIEAPGFMSKWQKEGFRDGEIYCRFLVLEHGKSPWRDASHYFAVVSAYDEEGRSLGTNCWRWAITPCGPYEDEGRIDGVCKSMHEAMAQVDEKLDESGYVLIGGPVQVPETA